MIGEWSPLHFVPLFQALEHRPVRKIKMTMRKQTIVGGLCTCTADDDVKKHVDAFKLLLELSQRYVPRLRSLEYTLHDTPSTVERGAKAVRASFYCYFLEQQTQQTQQILVAQLPPLAALRNLRRLRIILDSSDSRLENARESVGLTQLKSLAQRWVPTLPSLQCFEIRVTYPGHNSHGLYSWDEDRNGLRELPKEELRGIDSSEGESEDESEYMVMADANT